MTRPRTLLTLATTLALAAGIAACGGSDSGSSDVNPQKVLDQTFSNPKQIESANLDLSFELKATGDQSGSVKVDLSGPFDSSGSGAPKFDLTAEASGDASGQSFDVEAGAISTGEAGFVSYQGTDYQLTPQQYAGLQAIFATPANQPQSRATLPGLRESLIDVTNEGETEVEGTNTIHVSGKLDVSKLGDTIRSIAQKGTASGLSPTQAQQLQQAVPGLDQLDQLVKSATFDVFSGVDDRLLREFDFELSLAQAGGGSADLSVDIKLGDVNEPQEISTPAGAQPVSALLQKLAPFLSALGTATGTTPSTPSITPPSGADPALLDCLKAAKTPADLQACANQ